MDADPSDIAAIQRLIVDNERLPHCTACKQQSVVRMVYGYPTSHDFPIHSAYGGDEFGPNSATHFCLNCNHSWQDNSADELAFPFPSKCYFCDETLERMDQFAFQMLFESWIDVSGPPIHLEAPVFNENLFPACKECRESIQHNTQELQEERQQEQNQAFITQRMALVGLLVFLLLVAITVLSDSNTDGTNDEKDDHEITEQTFVTDTKFDATPREISTDGHLPKRVGRYKLLQKIGEGGMGTVWMADQETPVRRRVALKLIKSRRSNCGTPSRGNSSIRSMAIATL